MMPTHERKRPAVAERQFRDAMAQFATGVTIITAPATHGFVGFTANSFNSVSLHPPLVIWSLALRSRSLDAFEAAKYYAVNMLAYDQLDLARRFSRPHSDLSAGERFPVERGHRQHFLGRRGKPHLVGGEGLLPGDGPDFEWQASVAREL